MTHWPPSGSVMRASPRRTRPRPCTAQSMMRCVCAARCSSVAALRLVAMRQFLPPPVSGERSRPREGAALAPGREGKSRDMRCHVDACMPPCGVIRRQWLGLEHVEERNCSVCPKSSAAIRSGIAISVPRPAFSTPGAPRQHRNVQRASIQPARFRGIRQQPHQDVGLCQERLEFAHARKATLRQRATFSERAQPAT